MKQVISTLRIHREWGWDLDAEKTKAKHMKTERETQIDGYIRQHPADKLPGQLPVLYHGNTHHMDVYPIPFRMLIFNIANGRFAAELLDEQKRLNRKLDATRPEDAKIIRELLLKQSDSETRILREDLKENGQLDPGIITFDGAVINGNRRMAILQVLYEETGKDQFEYLKVARLPRGIDEKDLWKIEAKLQFGRDFRLEYGPVNELLKIRAGRASGLSAKQISDALMGR
jgi:hypothetical protein